MKPQRLLLSILVTFTFAYQVSSQGGYSSGGYSSGGASQGYSYPVPNRPLQYPGENEVVPTSDSYRRGRSRVTYGTPEDNVNSDLILSDRNKPGGTKETIRERTSTRTETSSRGGGGGGGRVVEEEVIIRRDPSPTPERVVERVVEEQVVSRGSQSQRGSTSSSYSSNPVTTRRRIVYVDPPAATVVRRRIIIRRRNGGSSSGTGGSSSSSTSYVSGGGSVGGNGGTSSTTRRIIHSNYGGGSTVSGGSSSDHGSSRSSSSSSQRYLVGGGQGGEGQTIRRRVYYTTVPSGISGSRVITRYVDRSRNSIHDGEYVDKPLYNTGSYRTRYRYVTRGGSGCDTTTVGCGGGSSTSSSSRSSSSGGSNSNANNANIRTSTRTIVNNRQIGGEYVDKQSEYDDYDDEPEPRYKPPQRGRGQNYGTGRSSQNSAGSGYTPGAGGGYMVPQQQYVVQSTPPAYVPPQVVSSPPAYQYYQQQYVPAPNPTTYVAPSQPSYIPNPTYIPQTVVTVPSQAAYVPQQIAPATYAPVVQQYPPQQGYPAYQQQQQTYGGGGRYIAQGGGYVQNGGGYYGGGFVPNGGGGTGGYVPVNGGGAGGVVPVDGGAGNGFGSDGGPGNGSGVGGGRRGGGGVRGNGSGTGRNGGGGGVGTRRGRSFLSPDNQDLRTSGSNNHPTYAFPGGGGGGGTQREVVEEVIYDERERDAGVTREEVLNSGGNVENIQDVRDRVNNEIVREEVIEERQRFVEGEGGDNGGGAIEERFVETGGDGGFSESGSSSTFTRRQTNLRDDRTNRNDRTRTGGGSAGSSRYSSTNIREQVSNKRPTETVIQRTVTRESNRASASTNRELANKAYGIGAGNDESISGSSTRRKLLETSFRKDVKAPSYGGVPDDENFNVRSNTERDFGRSASTRMSSSVSSQASGSSRSYSSIPDDEGESGNVIIRKTTTRILESSAPASSFESEKGIDSAQVVEGGTFAASNKDQVINRGGRTSSATRTINRSSSSSSGSSGGGRTSYGSLGDDSDGSGSTQTFRVSKFRQHAGDSHSAAASNTNSQFRLPANYRRLMTGTPDEVAAMTGATYMYTRAAPICPSGGCAPVASLRSGNEFRAPTSPTLFSAFRTPLNLEHL